MSAAFQPTYISLFESGELDRRAEEGLARLSSCSLCPWNCAVDRLEAQRAGLMRWVG